MTNVIVAFSKPEDAKSMKNILMRNGFQVIAVCTSGANVLTCVDGLSSGIVVCGYRFADMIYHEMYELLPHDFEMLLVASPSRWSSHMPVGIICLSMPLKVHDLVSSLEMIIETQLRKKKKKRLQPKERNDEERQLIEQAKTVLIERNNMSETEAHRYIQKCSMDSGTNMVETAQMVISLINV